jgi:amino acid transporter
MLLATYDYWGYYNVSLLGAEVQDPGRTIPRAILLSIAVVAVLYVAMNVSVLAVLPWQDLLSAQGLPARRAMVSIFMERAYTPTLGPALAHHLAQLAAILVMVTAFGSVFALLLGYSRIPYAAARDGNFFPVFARLHPTRGFPDISLLTLAAAAAVFCLFSLADVIAAMVVLRLLLQFLTQHIGVMVLRRTQPDLPRPFRLWLYPLPPIAALAGFTYILLARANFSRELALAAVLIAVGAALFFLRAHKTSPVSNL